MNVYVTPAEILKSLHDQFCDTLVAWADYEKPHRKLFIQNLVGHTTTKVFKDRHEVRRALLALHSGFLKSGDDATAGRVRSFVAYIDTLENQSKYTLREYYGRMTGIDLVPFTPEQIAEVKQTLMVYMRGVKPGFSEADFKNLEKIIEAAEPAREHTTFVDALQAQLEADKPDIRRLTGLNPDVPYNIGFDLLANGHRAQCGWEKGQVRVTFAKQSTSYRLTPHIIDIRHEVWGHGLQCISVIDAIAKGKLPRSFGIHTTTGSEIMQSEALAESVSRLFAPNTNLAHAANWHLMHRRMIGFNARLICEAKGEQAGRAYIAAEAPYIQKKHIDLLMNDMKLANRPNVHYPLVYAPVHFALNRFAHAVGALTFGKFIGEVMPAMLDAKGLNAAMERHSGSKRYNLNIAN